MVELDPEKWTVVYRMGSTTYNLVIQGYKQTIINEQEF